MKPIEFIPQLTPLLKDRRTDVRKNAADVIGTAKIAADITEARDYPTPFLTPTNPSWRNIAQNPD